MSRLALPLVLLVACAAPQETRGTTAPQPGAGAPAAAASGEDEQVCHEETPTGSHVSRTVCRSRAEIDREREQGQELQRRGNLAPAAPRRD